MAQAQNLLDKEREKYQILNRINAKKACEQVENKTMKYTVDRNLRRQNLLVSHYRIYLYIKNIKFILNLEMLII